MVTEWIEKRKVSQMFNNNNNNNNNNNAQGSRLRGRPENRWWNCVQILIQAKLKIGKRDQETELTGRSPLSRQRSALDCSAVEKKEEEEICLLRRCSYLMCCY